MKTRVTVSLAFLVLLASCASNEEFQQRMDDRNEAYSNYNDRRKARLDARQERTDMWYDRMMD
jgi:hypothetical protein